MLTHFVNPRLRGSEMSVKSTVPTDMQSQTLSHVINDFCHRVGNHNDVFPCSSGDVLVMLSRNNIGLYGLICA